MPPVHARFGHMTLQMIGPASETPPSKGMQVGQPHGVGLAWQPFKQAIIGHATSGQISGPSVLLSTGELASTSAQMGQLQGGGPLTYPLGQLGCTHAAVHTTGPSGPRESFLISASEMLPTSAPPSGGGAQVGQPHGEVLGTMPYGQLGSAHGRARHIVVPPVPLAAPPTPPAAPPLPPTFPPTPLIVPAVPPVLTLPPVPGVPPAAPPTPIVIPPPPIMPPMLVVLPPLPLLLPPLPPLLLLPPWPPSPRPELSVQATMNTLPEIRLTRIIDVLRIESSEVLLVCLTQAPCRRLRILRLALNTRAGVGGATPSSRSAVGEPEGKEPIRATAAIRCRSLAHVLVSYRCNRRRSCRPERMMFRPSRNCRLTGP